MPPWTLVVLACALCVDAVDDSNYREVKTAQGTVRGRKDVDNDLFVFYSIPYATAPLHEHKFKEPLPAPVWSEVYDATKDKGVICPQVKFEMESIMPKHLVMQEDCLIANVYVPDTEQNNLSVVVIVHGGGFQMGYSDMAKLKNFMKYKDILIVTFNYRVGVHGFLCLGTEDAPGNAGMKDQVALLRWVKKNIASFGGNPDDVTISGYSAGSAAVDLLMLSKSAEGLFHKVIPESGASLAAFTVQTDPLENAKVYARRLGFTNVDDIYALENFFKTTSLQSLNTIPVLGRTDSTFGLSPCVERDTNTEPFLTESPLSILKSGRYKKLPLLYGFANMEGLIQIELFDLFKAKMNEKFSDFLTPDLRFENEEEKEEVSNKIKEFYFGDKPVGNDNILNYVNYFSDTLFTISTLRAVKLHAEAGHDQVYLYEYSFVDEDTPVVPHTNIKGANHCAQTAAVVDGNFLQQDETILSEDFKNMKKIVREIWHNFIKTGKPVPEGSSLPAWPAAGADRSPHMSLELPLRLRGALLPERTRFWDHIYERYYREPTPPSPPPKQAEDKSNYREVKTAQGTVRGRKDVDYDLFVFYGVPYATAPVNEHKFKEPLPAPVWSGVYDATENKEIICPQYKFDLLFMNKNFVMQDDCLIANIYVPNTEMKNLSVLVAVHGGGFQGGYGEIMQLKNLMKQKDIIVVNFNYRLGAHGFLCLGTEDAPGNAGMKDQVALLRWVKKNIASFGGNPDDITISGASAGSAAVDLLMLSKSAEGLFHKVIPESGASLAAFTVQTDPLENAKSYARRLGFTDVDDIYSLENFFKTTPLKTLNSISFMDETDSTIGLSPCVERDTNTEPFLTESPLSILKSGNYKKLPLLYGFANMEGLLRIGIFESWKTRMNEKFSDFLTPDLQFKNEEEREKVSKEIKEFYFGDKPVDNDSILEYINYFSDTTFTISTLWAVKLHAEAGHDQVYLYEYSFVDEDTPVVPHTNIKGANHCAQSMAVIDGNFTHFDESIFSQEYKEMKKIIREMWYNFIKTGQPVPEGSSLPAWPAAGADRSPHMSLELPLRLRGALLPERTRFWDHIYEHYYREPTPPPPPPSAKHTEL